VILSPHRGKSSSSILEGFQVLERKARKHEPRAAPCVVQYSTVFAPWEPTLHGRITRGPLRDAEASSEGGAVVEPVAKPAKVRVAAELRGGSRQGFRPELKSCGESYSRRKNGHIDSASFGVWACEEECP
jgi:hypothetical protein